MNRNQGEGNLFFYIVFLIVITVIFGDFLGKLMEFIPYFVAGMASLLPFYGEAKRKSRSKKIHLRLLVKRIFSSSIIPLSIVSAVLLLMFRENIVGVAIATLALSTVGVLLVGCIYSIYRAVFKRKNNIELPSYSRMWKSLVTE